MAGRILVIGLDCAPPELMFDKFTDDMPNFKQLMGEGVWGELESVIPPITVPAWMCMMTSKTPGQLGFYGFRNRKDYSYDALYFATSTAVKEPLLWEILNKEGWKTITVGVPQTYPPRKVNGIQVSSFLTPSIESEYTYPPQIKEEIADLVGEYMIDVPNFRTDDKSYLLKQIYEMTEKRFKVIRHFMDEKEWRFFMFVEMGTDRIHHGIWKYFDEEHRTFIEDEELNTAMLEYYKYIDREIGTLLERMDEEDTIMVVSDHGAKRMDGGICFNEWLIKEGYLTVKEYPSEPVRMTFDMIDWSKTKAWGDGGYYGRLFINVKGREPDGIVKQSEYESLRNELQEKIAAIADPEGVNIGSVAHKPEDLYPEVNGVAPDLIVLFGDLFWRSVGTIGSGEIHTFENDTGPDDANHAMNGMFLIKHPGVEGGRKIEGAKLLDIAPTLLKLHGIDIPADMVGKPII
ncbi:MAG: alkaline phosphatase family protein [Candidatus Marinimicrobia bacterium]|nr:alkaline phosphatase family protein [Candidatus Neomarinimicrobiota bacterium]